jgi:hypothetical protein
VFGVRGLQRYAPNAWPPVRRRGAAIAGLVLAVMATALWTTILVGALSK